MSRIIRRSNTRPVWSREDVPSKLVLTGENFVVVTVFLWVCRVVKHRPVRGSQNLTWWSLEPETSRPFVGCQSQDLTSHPCPVRTISHVRAVKSNIFSVVSSEAERNFESLGHHVRSLTASWCASSTVSTLLKFGLQYLTSPFCPPDISQSWLCDQAADVTPAWNWS